MNDHKFTEKFYERSYYGWDECIKRKCIKCNKSLAKLITEINKNGGADGLPNTISTINKLNPCTVSDKEYELKEILK